MALQHMLHDGQPQASATRFAGAAAGPRDRSALSNAECALARCPGPCRARKTAPLRHGPAPGHGDGATRRCVAKGVADEIGQRTCSSVGTPAISPSARNCSAGGNSSTCGRAWLCVSNADSPRASSSQRCISACTGVHSVMPGNGLPSSRDSVSKSCTTLCMREACCDIMPR